MRGSVVLGMVGLFVVFEACDEHFPDPVVHGVVPPPVDDAGADADADTDAGVSFSRELSRLPLVVFAA